ncbi:GerAB/ArcD/ProY family transporter [Capillibacterium thermochitinicola]|uniref:GerAB/ArcD/ProY family transporter n=1 Tax=Capillibacterium thermochitinicola TaxID=2699427 RepID=A0A8J6LIY4_9FIRM|nr:GerAB/ArcD/ProY family transporter [Capillibacterium thermochitinicola]MBA2133520.1 GerAB/ArcD/ProY family transporter [Capillibacterium thermochitinicola]
MNGKQRLLSARQITLLVLGFGIGGGVLTLPSSAAAVFGPSGWLLVFVLGLLYTGSGWIAARLAAKFPEETIIEYSPRLLGKWFGFLFNVVFILHLFLVIPVNIRILQELVNISLLPGAPTWFVSGSYLLVMIYGATRPVDQIAQVNELLIEIAVLIGSFVALAALQHFKLLHLMPLFSWDQLKLDKIDQLVGMTFAFGSIPVVSMVVPYIQRPQQVTKATVKAILIITVVYTFFTISVLGVFGYKEAIDLSWVALELAKSVNIQAVILQRLDLILIVSWISALFTTGFISSFLVGSGLAQLLRVRKRSAILWGLVPVIYYLSTLLKNYFVWSKAGFYVALLSLVITFFCYPLLYLLSLWKGKRHV